jgi:hypothetical protein
MSERFSVPTIVRSEIVVLSTIKAGPVVNGEGRAMAKAIEYHVPGNFRSSPKWVPLIKRGKVIQFPALQKKSA